MKRNNNYNTTIHQIHQRKKPAQAKLHRMSSHKEEMTTVAVESGDSKQMKEARAAYRERDVERSIAEHAKPTPEPHGGTGSDYVKSLVFGGLDGIMTTFAIVCSSAGAEMSWKTVLVFGFSNAIADGWAMGFGEFVSGNAAMDYARSEREREEWEVETNIEGERKEMMEIYEKRGYSPEDAQTLVSIISKDTKLFVDVMMVEELGILVDLDDQWEPLKQGIVMFCSFVCFGMFPLIAYMFGHGKGMDNVFYAACAITGLGLMLLGAAKGVLTSSSVPTTAMIMLFNGCVSGVVSFGIGQAINNLIEGNHTTAGSA